MILMNIILGEFFCFRCTRHCERCTDRNKIAEGCALSDTATHSIIVEWVSVFLIIFVLNVSSICVCSTVGVCVDKWKTKMRDEKNRPTWMHVWRTPLHLFARQHRIVRTYVEQHQCTALNATPPFTKVYRIALDSVVFILFTCVRAHTRNLLKSCRYIVVTAGNRLFHYSFRDRKTINSQRRWHRLDLLRS